MRTLQIDEVLKARINLIAAKKGIKGIAWIEEQVVKAESEETAKPAE